MDHANRHVLPIIYTLCTKNSWKPFFAKNCEWLLDIGEKYLTRCQIWGFHDGEDSSRRLLGCNTVYWHRRIPSFQRSSSWRWRQHGSVAWTLKRWYSTTALHGVTTQKTSTCIWHVNVQHLRITSMTRIHEWNPLKSYGLCLKHNNVIIIIIVVICILHLA